MAGQKTHYRGASTGRPKQSRDQTPLQALILLMAFEANAAADAVTGAWEARAAREVDNRRVFI